MSAVSVRLEMHVSGSSVKAHLTFLNASSQDAFLEKSKAIVDGSLENNVFRITSAEKKLPYIGIMAKRGEPSPEDFLRLPPGQQFGTTVDLTMAYEFLPGTHNYRIYYTALHAYTDNKDFWALRSNEVLFTLHK